MKWLFAAALLTSSAAAQTAVIIDTDAGSDDLMAISFLLSRADVRVEALTAANGLAHVQAGAQNLLRLLALAGKREIPVFEGRPEPLRGNRAFPDAWRKNADELPGVQLPRASRKPEKQGAAEYLAARLSAQGRPVRILALGPLTNLAEALEKAPAAASGVTELVIMGGAVRVPGNLGDGGYYATSNREAEWNIFVDPPAARRVFAARWKIRLVPLDATNQVRIDGAFLRQFAAQAHTPLGRAVNQVLDTEREQVEQQIFYAWDPLAAVALVNHAALRFTPLAIEIRENGRTAEVRGKTPNAEVALGADPAAFRRVFLGAFAR